MTDLLSRANVDIAINTLLDDLQPNDAIQPSDHNGLLKDILDTLSNGLSTTLRTGNTTDGQNMTITSSSIFQFENGSNGRLQSDSLTAFRNWTLPDKNGTVAMLTDITGGDNLATADLTQTDTIRTYTLPSGSNKFLDILGDSDNGLRLLNNADFILNTSTDGTGVNNMRLVSVLNQGRIEFNNNFWKIHAISSSNMFLGSTNGTKGSVTIETGVVVRTPGTAGATSLSGPEIRFYDRALSSQWAKFDINGRFIFGSNSFIGAEKFSIQNDTLIKGSNNAVGTSGFKVTDINDNSLLDVKNNGKINASSLPTSSAGLSSGDIWNNSGVLNIV